MQNQYVGDIGDYGKYGLLRALFPRGSTDRLGIVWYLVPDEVKKNDGRHIDYLNTFRFKGCDPVLFDALRLLIRDGVRNVSEIENVHLFPSETVFHRKELSFEGVSASSEKGRNRRLSVRQEWLDEALTITKNCSAVFLDPDNGIETPSVKKHAKDGPKYVFLDEIQSFVSRRQTTIVYHHLSRQGTHELQIKQRQDQLSKRLGLSSSIFALHFSPYSPRAYFIIPSPARQTDIRT